MIVRVVNGDKFRVADAWSVPEPLIGKYNIESLKNPNYVGKDWSKMGTNSGQYKANYRGLARVKKDEG